MNGVAGSQTNLSPFQLSPPPSSSLSLERWSTPVASGHHPSSSGEGEVRMAGR